MAQWIHSVLTKNSWVSHHGVVGAAALPGTGPIGSALVTSAPRRAAMDQYVALDVSLKEVSVCVLGAGGTLIYEGRTASDPASLVGLIRAKAPRAVRIGLETGSTSAWLAR